MDENATSLNDYFIILRRRKMQIIIPALIVVVLSVGVAFGLPPVYRSTATIMIEQQEVPPELVESTVTSYASERIRVITEFIMTRSNLLSIVEEYNLYPELRKEDDLDEILYQMRKSIDIIPVSAEIIARQSGKASTATIAFEVSFESDTPETAQKVTDKLVSLFLEKNASLRTQSAEATTEFLGREAERLSREISKLEEKLTAYKENNVGQLPQLFDFNLKLLEQTESKLEAARHEISSLEERKAALIAQLSGVEPYVGSSPESHLEELKMELLDAKAKYTPGHPDILHLQRKIEILEDDLGVSSSTGQLQQKAAELSKELAQARSRYSEQHPDVVELKRSLAALESEISRAEQRKPTKKYNIKANNPAYISLQSQLEGLDVRIKAERGKQKELEKKIEEYQNRIERMPRIEQEGLVLQRDYDNAVKKYQEIKEKQLRAEIASQLEREEKGETFSVLDPPTFPLSPHKPNRFAILIVGMFFSFTSGIAYAGFSEYLDTTVRGVKGVKSVLKAPPLATIPYIRNTADIQHQRRNKIGIATGTILLIVLLITVVHVYLVPIDTLWSDPNELPDQQEATDG